LQRETPRGLGAEMPVGCGELGDACCVLAIEDGEQAAVVGPVDEYPRRHRYLAMPKRL
jgi:hypothetical protein